MLVLTSLSCGPLLLAGEVGRHGDDSVTDTRADIRLSRVLHLSKHHCTDLKDEAIDTP